jgi:AcrR family transcriptional regulator
VAERAGVSLRSVYVHFDDVEALFVAASARHYERLQTLPSLQVPIDPTAARSERIARIVERRRDVFEHGGQVRRAALVQEPFSPALQRALDFGRRASRSETEAMFAPELDAVCEAERPRLRAAIETALSGFTWDALRTHHGFAIDEAAALVRDMVSAALDAWTTPAAPPTGAPAAPGAPGAAGNTITPSVGPGPSTAGSG